MIGNHFCHVIYIYIYRFCAGIVAESSIYIAAESVVGVAYAGCKSLCDEHLRNVAIQGLHAGLPIP